MNNTTTSSHFSGTTGIVFTVALAISVLLFIAILIYSCLKTSSILRGCAASAEERGGDSILVVIQSDGLDAAAISTFPLYTYALIKGTATAACTICLVDFVDGDTVRVLPECCHVFHRSCIDPWLMRISRCPLCRHQPLMATAAPPPNVALSAAPVLANRSIC